MTSTASTEAILEPELPIIDPHHHLWDWPAAVLSAAPDHGFTTVVRRAMRYLLPEFLSDLDAGHNIRATVFVQCGAMYRADGPEAFKPVGETEFVNGVAPAAPTVRAEPAPASWVMWISPQARRWARFWKRT